MFRWRSSAAPARASFRPVLRPLEDRTVPDTTGVTGSADTVTVNNPSDTTDTTPAVTTTSTTGSDTTATTTGNDTTTTTGSDTTTTTGSDTTTTSGSDTTTTTGSDTTTTDGDDTITTTSGDDTVTTTAGGDDTVTTTTTPPPPPTFAVGSDVGSDPRVKVVNKDGVARLNFLAYERTFTGGVRVATGDFTGDGVDDIVTAPGRGTAPVVKVFDGASGNQILSFTAYDSSFRGGVHVAVGDVTGDGRADIVTGAGVGGGPHVKVYNGALLFPRDGEAIPTEISVAVDREYFAYDAGFTGGVSVAAADANDDGFAEVMTGAGEGGGPHVKVYDGQTNAVVRNFFAFDALFNGGVFVAAGDLSGDGRADFAVGMGLKGIATVKVYDGKDGRQVQSFSATETRQQVAVKLLIRDVTGDGKAEMMTAVKNVITVRDGTTMAKVSTASPFNDEVGGLFMG